MMGLKLFIQRPVLAITLCLLIVLLGITSYLTLPVRQYPLLPSYKVVITTVFPGADPKTMEGFVTIPMQEALSGLEHLDYISSKNIPNQSEITLKFFLGVDIDKLLPQINARIASINWKLPKHINSPIVKKVNPNQAATGAILYISTLSTKLSMEQMSEYISHVVAPRFEAIKGVANLQLFGGREFAMRIWLDPIKMAAMRISASDVVNALLSHNMRSTSGTLNTPYARLDVTAGTNLSSAKEFNNIIVKSSDGAYIKIKDIGDARMGSMNYLTNAFANGKPGVMIGVLTTDQANSLDTAKRVVASLHDIQPLLPPGLQLKLVWNVTQFAKASIQDVYLTIAEAGLFVFLVVFLFLGSLRSIVVPMVTIPLSILGAAALMSVLHYSINTLTLLAWVIAIGLVVDDSIVVVENIHRHMELGFSRFQSAVDGVYELRFAIITMTLSVAIVFTPIGFVPGVPGALFKPFAFTMSLVVIISGILALYVSPMMCTKLIPSKFSEKSLTARMDRVFDKFRGMYKRLLSEVMSMRWLVFTVYILLLLGGLELYESAPGQLAPTENEGVIIGLGIAPGDANLDYMMKYSPSFNKIYGDLPEHQAYGLLNAIPLFGTNVANSWVLLKPRNERKRSEDQVIKTVRHEMDKIPGLLSIAVKMPPIPGALPGQPLKFVLKSIAPYSELNEQMQRLIAVAQKYPGLSDPNTDFRMDKVNINVLINRDKAAELGVPVSEISNTLTIMLGEPTLNRFGTFGYSYEVIPQVFRKYRLMPDSINMMYVKTIAGDLVPLSNVVKITKNVMPESLDEFQQVHSATLKASIANGYTMGQVLNFLEGYVNTHMPEKFNYDFIGQTRQYVHSQGALFHAFVFALALIYLLLAAHFNSFRDPLIVMLSVPLAITGALYVMYLTGSALNIYTKVGLLMLVGLISKHGILIVDFANIRQRSGLSRFDAAIEGASIRLRPILMTASAMIFGALPLVLSHGAGSIARREIGWVIIGGMALGTCLTLFVVPTFYSLIAKKVEAKPEA